MKTRFSALAALALSASAFPAIAAEVERLEHGVIDRDMVEAALWRMAEVVDRQNAGDPSYQPMTARGRDCLPIRASRALILEGREQPSGFTEPVLHRLRAEAKHG